MKLTKSACAILLTLGASAAHAESIISITHTRAFETAATAMSGGGFLEITNTGDTDDTLVGIVADFPSTQLHTTEFNDGIASMKHVDGISIPAGQTVTLEPGGYHIMFMGLKGDPFEIGETIPATLVFEHAGDIDVSFDVVAREMAHTN